MLLIGPEQDGRTHSIGVAARAGHINRLVTDRETALALLEAGSTPAA